MPKDLLLVPGKNYAQTPPEVASVDAPPSKSLSHRALVAAALAGGESRLENVLESDDTAATADILRKMGAKIEPQGKELIVRGLNGKIRNTHEQPLDCNVHDSGTSCRLLAAVLAAGLGNFRLFGSQRMSERPMFALAEALRSLGADIRFERQPGYLPFTIAASGLGGGEVRIDSSQSSQFLSGLLLAAPLGNGLSLLPEVPGASGVSENTLNGKAGGIVSWSYVLLTLQILEDFGIDFEVESRDDPTAPWRAVDWRKLTRTPQSGLCRISVRKGAYRAGKYAIEGDFSNASYFLAAGAVGKRTVRVGNLNPASVQGDRAIISIIRGMGCKVTEHGGSVEVTPPARPLQGINVDMGDCPDLVPTVAAMAAFAQGSTVISGVAHLRIKESDRIAAPAAELAKVGCEVLEQPDGMIIIPPAKLTPPQIPFETYNDHRMAMSLSLFSCAGFDVGIKHPSCVGKSFPGFWELWAQI